MSAATRPSRSSRTALVCAAAVGVVVLGLVAVLATRDAGPRAAASPLLGKPAPTIEGETLSGEAFDLDQLRGRWVLVNFFATWCPPCLVEHPQLVAFHEAHAEAGDVEVVSVAFDDRAENIATFFAEHGGTWPVLAEGVNHVAVRWGVARLPESYLVSPQGIVVHKFTGGVTYDGLEAALSQARGGPAQVPEASAGEEDR